MNIRENVEAVLEAIRVSARRAGRSEEDIRLVAVTKTVPEKRMFEAAAAGVRIFGENRIQEALGKQDTQTWPEGIQWHFIGHIQKNKAKKVLGRFSMIESLDSLDLALMLDDHCRSAAIRMPVLMEVNLGREDSKYGFLPEDAEFIAHRISKLEYLDLQGLMTVPPYSEDAEETRPYFHALKSLRERICAAGIPLRELSMGMSHDFPIAVEEGATMVRVGSAIFGERPAV